jgi:hypothetical protein
MRKKKPLIEQGFSVITPNQQTEKPFVLFQRVEDEVIKQQTDKTC